MSMSKRHFVIARDIQQWQDAAEQGINLEVGIPAWHDKIMCAGFELQQMDVCTCFRQDGIAPLYEHET